MLYLQSGFKGSETWGGQPSQGEGLLGWQGSKGTDAIIHYQVSQVDKNFFYIKIIFRIYHVPGYVPETVGQSSFNTFPAHQDDQAGN